MRRLGSVFEKASRLIERPRRDEATIAIQLNLREPAAFERPAPHQQLSGADRIQLGLTACEQRGVEDVERLAVAGHRPRPLFDNEDFEAVG
jgi:hypothetical protein